jgi:hypothetical protein
MNYIINKLPKHLFWDSDMTLLDDVEHHEKIIIRTFERGDLEDIALVMAYYGREICSEVLQSADYLPERALIFATNFLNLSADQFRSKQATQYHAL